MQREKQIQELSSRQLLSANEQFVFSQWATYQGGVAGYPNAAIFYGVAVVLTDSFVFLGKSILFKLPYMKVLEVKLDYFQPGAVRGFLAAGAVGMQLQQTKNIFEICYLAEHGTERSARFQIHGSATIPGEAVKARELLNQLLEFKGSFASTSNVTDPIAKLDKLKALKDRGVISEAEFEMKKRILLDQM